VTTGCLGIVAAVLAGQCAAAVAQTTVYESKDKAGPVYSDRPASGATLVELPPPNIIGRPTLAPVAPPPQPSAPGYRSLAIVSPAEQATLHSNTGSLDVSVRADPRLRASDRVRVTLDGHLLSPSFRSTSLHIGESQWQGAAIGDSVEHTLQVAIAGGQGKVLIESAPVRF